MPKSQKIESKALNIQNLDFCAKSAKLCANTHLCVPDIQKLCNFSISASMQFSISALQHFRSLAFKNFGISSFHHKTVKTAANSTRPLQTCLFLSVQLDVTYGATGWPKDHGLACHAKAMKIFVMCVVKSRLCLRCKIKTSQAPQGKPSV